MGVLIDSRICDYRDVWQSWSSISLASRVPSGVIRYVVVQSTLPTLCIAGPSIFQLATIFGDVCGLCCHSIWSDYWSEYRGHDIVGELSYPEVGNNPSKKVRQLLVDSLAI